MEKQDAQQNRKHKFTLMLDKDFLEKIRDAAERDGNRSTTNYIINCIKKTISQKTNG